jgi:hypothetical protein
MASSRAKTVREYLASLPPERRRTVAAVRELILEHLPRGYEETMQYGMIGYSVPLSRYPNTYNGQPLTVAALAAQKGYTSLYLMAVYGDRGTERWFAEAFRKAGKKLDMGKSCVRFKSLDDLPLPVIGQAIARTSVDDFIAFYERTRGKARPKRTAKGRSPKRSVRSKRKRATRKRAR